jgi:predicted DNA-binding protein (UPF0251 family)
MSLIRFRRMQMVGAAERADRFYTEINEGGSTAAITQMRLLDLMNLSKSMAVGQHGIDRLQHFIKRLEAARGKSNRAPIGTG